MIRRHFAYCFFHAPSTIDFAYVVIMQSIQVRSRLFRHRRAQFTPLIDCGFPHRLSPSLSTNLRLSAAQSVSKTSFLSFRSFFSVFWAVLKSILLSTEDGKSRKRPHTSRTNTRVYEDGKRAEEINLLRKRRMDKSQEEGKRKVSLRFSILRRAFLVVFIPHGTSRVISVFYLAFLPVFSNSQMVVVFFLLAYSSKRAACWTNERTTEVVSSIFRIAFNCCFPSRCTGRQEGSMTPPTDRPRSHRVLVFRLILSPLSLNRSIGSESSWIFYYICPSDFSPPCRIGRKLDIGCSVRLAERRIKLAEAEKSFRANKQSKNEKKTKKIFKLFSFFRLYIL